ncbi:MAG: hypothetical protein QOH05_2271 [Acetobacteraceae bacterium]|jgi:hypothetical protein|nr:hypothetical protein [Acetobacteraceae bacterium]
MHRRATVVLQVLTGQPSAPVRVAIVQVPIVRVLVLLPIVRLPLPIARLPIVLPSPVIVRVPIIPVRSPGHRHRARTCRRRAARCVLVRRRRRDIPGATGAGAGMAANGFGYPAAGIADPLRARPAPPRPTDRGEADRADALPVRPKPGRGDLQRVPVRIAEIQAGAAARPRQPAFHRDPLPLQVIFPGRELTQRDGERQM